jgi:hypothetical protein
MNIARVKNTPQLLLLILLGAVLSVLCMNMTIHTSPHSVHQHAPVRISYPESETTNNGCMPGHSSLIYTLTQGLTTTAAPLIFLLFIFSIFYVFRVAGFKTVSKQFYKTRWRLAQQIFSKHVLHWLAILQKQDSYQVVVA